MIIKWNLKKNAVSGKDVLGKITLQANKIHIEIPISLKYYPIKTEINPIVIKKGEYFFHPKLSNKIEKGILFVEFQTFQEIFSYACKEMNGDLIISMPGETLLIKTKEKKALLLNQNGSHSFDLGSNVQVYKGLYWIPMNNIFKHLSIDVPIQDFPVILELP